MSEQETVFPQVVTCGPEGFWNDDNYGSSTNDDDVWIQTGWRIRTYDGIVLFRHEEKQPCEHWLAKHDYQVCEDGEHYRRNKGE